MTKTKNKSILLIITILMLCFIFLLFALLMISNPPKDTADGSKGIVHAKIMPSVNKGKPHLLYKKANKLFYENKIDEALGLYQQITLEFKDSSLSADAWYKIAQIYQAKGLALAARDAYKNLVKNFPNFSNISNAQNQLGNLNVMLLFSPAPTPESTYYEVKKGDNIGKIAKKFNTTTGLIKKSNNIKPNGVIYSGMKLKVPSIKFSVVVNKAQNTLILKSNEDVFKIYRVATGAKGCTPTGTFKIVNKLVDPVWFKEAGIRIESGSPQNILGTRWLGITKAGYGIHGTTDPESIGKQTTAGCVRMRNVEVEELYDILPVDTEVTILD